MLDGQGVTWLEPCRSAIDTGRLVADADFDLERVVESMREGEDGEAGHYFSEGGHFSGHVLVPAEDHAQAFKVEDAVALGSYVMAGLVAGLPNEFEGVQHQL